MSNCGENEKGFPWRPKRVQIKFSGVDTEFPFMSSGVLEKMDPISIANDNFARNRIDSLTILIIQRYNFYWNILNEWLYRSSDWNKC